METRANHAIIGAFTVLVVAIAFVLIYWVTHVGGGSSDQKDMKVVMRGAVTGLDTGNRVLFDGIQIGAVTGLMIDPNDPNQVIATVRVSADAPIKADTAAALTMDLLGGAAYIQLTGGTASLPDLLDQEGVPTILADTAGFADLLAGAQTIVTGVNTTVDRLNTLLDNAGPDLARSIQNVGTFTDALAANTAGVQNFLAAVGGMAGTIQTVGDQLNATIAGLENVLNAVDADRVRNMIANADTAVGNIAAATGGVQGVVANIGTAADTLNDLAGGLQTAVAQVNALVAQAGGIIGAVNPIQIAAAIQGVTGFVTRLDDATANIGEIVDNAQTAIAQFSAFGTGINATRANLDTLIAAVDPAQVQSLMANVDAFGQQLAGAGTRIDGIVDRVDTVVGQAQTLVGAIDPAQITTAVAGVTGFIDRINGATLNIDAIMADAQTAIAQFSAFGAGINATRANLDTLIAAVDPAEVQALMGNVGAFGEQLAAAGTQIDGIVGRVDAVVTQAQTVIGAIDPAQITTAVADVTGFVGRLNGATLNIDAIMADAQTAIAQFSDFAEGLNATRAHVDTLVAAVDPATIQHVIANVDTFGTQLAAAGTQVQGVVDRVDAVVGRAETLLAAVDPDDVAAAVASLRDVVGQAQQVVAAIDPAVVHDAVVRVGTVVDRLDQATTNVGAIVTDAQTAVGGFSQFATNLNDTLGNVDALVAAIDPAQIATVIDNIDTVTTALRGAGAQIDAVLGDAGTAVANLTAFTGDLAAHGTDIDQIVAAARQATTDAAGFVATIAAQGDGIATFVTEANDLVARLNVSSTQLDGILTNVGTLFDTQNADGFFQQATAAVASIRAVADALQARSDDILGGIQRFSTAGLDNITALIGDARTTVQRIDQFATELERAPAQVLLNGGTDVRDYNRH